MKRTAPRPTTSKKLALKRDIIRQLTSSQLAAVVSGTNAEDKEIECSRCLNPIYSA